MIESNCSIHSYISKVIMAASASSKMVTWEPNKLTQASYALLVLNQPVKVSNFNELWNQASFRICVDGGTNRLHEIRSKFGEAAVKLPDLITGDFDSIQDSVKDHYADQRVKVVNTPDQDDTDFTKALMELRRGQEAGEYPEVDAILVVAEGSGRYDQFFANINALVKSPQEVKLFIISQESISWILRAGSSHKLVFDQDYVNIRPHCGLIPFAGKAALTTKGLRWNLDNTDCYFGGMVSTSNEVTETIVEVTASADLLWTMQNNSLP